METYFFGFFNIFNNSSSNQYKQRVIITAAKYSSILHALSQ